MLTGRERRAEPEGSFSPGAGAAAVQDAGRRGRGGRAGSLGAGTPVLGWWGRRAREDTPAAAGEGSGDGRGASGQGNRGKGAAADPPGLGARRFAASVGAGERPSGVASVNSRGWAGGVDCYLTEIITVASLLGWA